MRKFLFVVLHLVFISDVWAVCQPTTNVLQNRSAPDHNEYLYADTRQREIRQNGGQGEAYLCGYEDRGGCAVGEMFVLENAAVGADSYNRLAVYTCSGGGDNYYWTTALVKEKCFLSVSDQAGYIQNLSLYKVGNDYCKVVDRSLNDFDRIITYLEEEDINKNLQLKDIWEELGGLKGQIKTEAEFVEAVEEIISQSSLNETQMTEVVFVINQAISNLGLDSKFKNITDSINALNNRMNDFDRIITYLEKEDINKNLQLKDIWEELNGLKGQIKTEAEFVEAVEEIISQSSLNETQMTEVVFIINQTISNLGLEEKFKNISIDIEGIKEAIAYNNDMIDQLFQDLKTVDTNLNQEITKLQKSINGRPTVAQVNSLIQTALSSVTLNATQRAEVQKMIEEYAKSLSPEQKKAVELLIKTTVNPQFEALKQADATQNKQNISRDKVHSAMSVLNAFAAGQDASVWRNADGKFNTARLASDATAGVILGTAGGLISNKLIKKNQVKKGFEGIGCYVGGQAVAEFGDEFTVGIM